MKQKLRWLDENCNCCGKQINNWDKRISKTLAYQYACCEHCIAKEYDIDVEAFRHRMENYFGMRPCLGLQVDKMNEYNLFTQKLFAQGYPFEHYPDYAKLPHHGCDKHLFEILGGFEYERHYLYNKVYATGCGLLCKGSEFSNGYMSFAGID